MKALDSHAGPCALDYTEKSDRAHLLSCQHDKRHRYVLKPRSRSGVMLTLLASGLLTGQAERDARAIAQLTALGTGRAAVDETE